MDLEYFYGLLLTFLTLAKAVNDSSHPIPFVLGKHNNFPDDSDKSSVNLLKEDDSSDDNSSTEHGSIFQKKIWQVLLPMTMTTPLPKALFLQKAKISIRVLASNVIDSVTVSILGLKQVS